MRMKKMLIAGNWKMHKCKDEALKFIYQINTKISSNKQLETVIFPQFTLLDILVQNAGSNLKIGAQNMFYQTEGAFTGEVSPMNLTQMGVKYVLLGHSERRNLFHETDELINLKLLSALKFNLKPILCIGESLKNDDIQKIELALKEQLKKTLKGISISEIINVVIAYEPTLFIGTGQVDSINNINLIVRCIRQQIAQMFSFQTANEIRIIYGGSVDCSNVQKLLEKVEIDGVLVGKASLSRTDFLNLNHIAEKILIDRIKKMYYNDKNCIYCG